MSDIEKLRIADQNNFEVAWRSMGDSGTLVEDLVELYAYLGDLVKRSGVVPSDEIVAGSMFLLACRYQLVVGAITAVRGHLNDSGYFTRKAIELCAFAVRIKNDPTLAMKWLTAWKDGSSYKEFRKEFRSKKLFPMGHELLRQLYDRYDFWSKMVHPSVFSFGGHVEATRGQDVFELEYSYSQLRDADPSEPIRTFLSIVDTHFGILRVFEEILSDVITFDKAGWEVRRNAVDAKLAVHKHKWREVLLHMGDHK